MTLIMTLATIGSYFIFPPAVTGVLFLLTVYTPSVMYEGHIKGKMK